MSTKVIAIVSVVCILVTVFSGCIDTDTSKNHKPQVVISFPSDRASVSSLVMISGTASDADGDEELEYIQVKIDNLSWMKAEGTTQWSFEWNAYEYSDGIYPIYARSWDGKKYSEVQSITVEVDNPEVIDTDSHKWALFVVASNFPKVNESKLGNGGLFLAEDIATYFVQNCRYATSNIFILFDDGWIRSDNGYGEKEMTLQQREHDYDFTYGSATKDNLEQVLDRLINESNMYRDSEVFIWMFNHGYGDLNNSMTGGKLLESSQIFLWDDIMSDRELGELLFPLKSKKTTIMIDACFCGGFADKTIYNLPTSLLFRSGIPRSGRVVIAGASKYRVGYASTTQGPLFTLLWFEGLRSGDADGFVGGLLNRGKPTRLRLFKDGEVSVEEAFYYARYMLSNDENLEDYNKMEPQINDRYPHRGVFFSRKGLILGET